MTAMLTLRRADPCNGGAGGENHTSCLPMLPILSFPLTSPARAKDAEEKGHCQHPTGPGTKGGSWRAGEMREGQSQEVCACPHCSKPCHGPASPPLQVLPYLLSCWGIGAKLELVLKTCQAFGSHWDPAMQSDLPVLSWTSSLQPRAPCLSPHSPLRLTLHFASSLGFLADLFRSWQLAGVALLGDPVGVWESGRVWGRCGSGAAELGPVTCWKVRIRG